MEYLPIFPAFGENNLAITMQTSDFFAPYASVTALSIIENASPNYNYDIIFMTWDMREETEKRLLTLAMGKRNISVRVVNVLKDLRLHKKIAETSSGFGRFSYTGMVRLLLPQLLEQYACVLNLDCDMLVCSDVAEVFQYDISNYCMGAVPDVFCYTINRRPGEDRYSDAHMLERLGLRSSAEYINGGFLLLNLRLIRESYTVEQVMNFAIRDGTILRCYEQDTFSGLFQDKKLLLPFEWNWFNDIPRLIGPFTKYLPANDPYLEAHRKAESHIKNIHYVTDKKPWLTNIAYPHAKEWWAVAQRSPFLSDIISRATTNNLQGANDASMSAEPRILFYCASGYQLLNAVNLKFRYYVGAEADMILCGKEVLGYKSKLEQTGLFHHIFPLEWDARSVEASNDISSLRTSYTDLFVPDSTSDLAWKAVTPLIKSKQAVVHLYEGGGFGAYTQDFSHLPALSEDDATTGRIKDIFLYDLEAHSNGGNPFPLLQIPPVRKEDAAFVPVLEQIFGKCTLPEQRYIFLQESFSEEGLACNDSTLLDAVAEVTGRENIAVRLHPHAAPANETIYRLHGYHVCPSGCMPWELMPLLPGFEDKVLLSISSTALLTPNLAYGGRVRAISLFELMPLSRRVSNIGDYRRFLNTLRRETAMLSCPKSMAELQLVLRYIEGVM